MLAGASSNSPAVGLSGPPSFSSVQMNTRRSEGLPFMEACFRGFCLSAEVHGEEMDGVLASVALEDVAVYEVRLGIPCFRLAVLRLFCSDRPYAHARVYGVKLCFRPKSLEYISHGMRCVVAVF